MTKPFKSIDEQIELLKNRNLIFLNEETAKRELAYSGYYEIINGYKDPFLDHTSDNDYYLENTTFEKILAFFDFDKRLRYTTLNSMLEVEKTLKTAVAYIIARDFTSEHENYMIRENFKSGRPAGKNKDGSNYYKVDQLFKKLNYIINEKSEPFKHYREKHNNIPPWILVKGMTFGNIYTMFKLLKKPQKDAVISMLYGVDSSLVTSEMKNLTNDLLYVCLKMRNRCAHSGRVYNYFSNSAKFRYSKILHPKMSLNEADFRNGYGVNGISAILPALELLDNRDPYVQLLVGLSLSLQEFLQKYPHDKEFICNEMKFKKEAFNNIYHRFK